MKKETKNRKKVYKQLMVDEETFNMVDRIKNEKGLMKSMAVKFAIEQTYFSDKKK